MPKLPLTKIILGILLVIFAVFVGLAIGTLVFRMVNPDRQISIGPLKAGPEPSPIPSPTALPSPSPTLLPSPAPLPIPEDWETYSNDILGFTFQYPPDVTVTSDDLRAEEITDNFITPAEFTFGVTLGITDLEFVVIASSVNVHEESLPIDIEQKAFDIQETSTSVLSIEEVDFAGGTAFKVIEEDSAILLYNIFSFGRDSASEISISVTADNTSDELIDQILSTFQFL